MTSHLKKKTECNILIRKVYLEFILVTYFGTKKSGVIPNFMTNEVQLKSQVIYLLASD